MRTYTIEKTVYNYSELSADAKENVKWWYLNGQDPEFLSEMMKEDLSELFPNSKLNVQFSLSCCQGDGVNVYGDLSLEDAVSFCKDELSAKELKFLKWAADASGRNIKLPYNQRYCYSLKNQRNLLEDIVDDLEWDNYKNIKYDFLQHFEKVLQNKLSALDSDYEKWGYEYFYEIEEDELEDICNSNEWEFYEDGSAA